MANPILTVDCNGSRSNPAVRITPELQQEAARIGASVMCRAGAPTLYVDYSSLPDVQRAAQQTLIAIPSDGGRLVVNDSAYRAAIQNVTSAIRLQVANTNIDEIIQAQTNRFSSVQVEGMSARRP